MRALFAIVALAALALAQYVSWHPPHAFLVQAYPLNATHLAAYEGGRVVYIAQQGIAFSGSGAEGQAALQYLSAQCKYVAVDVLNASAVEGGELWLSDVYCSADGRQWLWLRWLPLRFAAYRGRVEFINATNATVSTPVGQFAGCVPAGWYLDPATKAVFALPQFNASLLAEVHRLSAAIRELRARLQRSESEAGQAASLIAQLRAQVSALEAQRLSLEEALRQRESMMAAMSASLRALSAENEALRGQVERLRREAEELRAALAGLNATCASRVSQLEAELQLAKAQAAGERGGPDALLPLLAALASIAVAAALYKRRRARE